MSKEKMKKINYIVICISEFAEKTDLSLQQAFRYLHDHKGIEFLDEHYEIEHTLSLDEAIEDLKLICEKSGGKIA